VVGLTIFTATFLALFALTSLTKPPFRLNRKVIAKLPYAPSNLLITDLDSDGHPEILAEADGETPVWSRSPFGEPSTVHVKGCSVVWTTLWVAIAPNIPIRAVPVWVGKKLRLLRWQNGKVVFEPLPPLPDEAFDHASLEGGWTGKVFLAAYLGENAWVFVLTEKGDWKFAGKFTSAGFREPVIDDLADLDKDGKLDAICTPWSPEWACVVWGNGKGESELGEWSSHGSPLVSDLNGDGWDEIAMVAPKPQPHLQIWRFAPKQGKLRVIAKSPPLGLAAHDFFWQLFDLDKDRLREIVVWNYGHQRWLVFKFEGGNLKMWQGAAEGTHFPPETIRIGRHDFLVTEKAKQVILFPPLIWIDKDFKLRWELEKWMDCAVFWELPEGKDALMPSKWKKYEATFDFLFAADIDGGGKDEVIGRDARGRVRLYWFRKTKSGELRWQSWLLDRRYPQTLVLIQDGGRRGLCVGWDDGTVELLTVQ
jgi:hypothetical protein